VLAAPQGTSARNGTRTPPDTGGEWRSRSSSRTTVLAVTINLQRVDLRQNGRALEPVGASG
jgi:hypothetical protein